MDEWEYLIAKCVQAVRDGEAQLTAILDEGRTFIRLVPTFNPEEFEKYWEGLDDDVCD